MTCASPKPAWEAKKCIVLTRVHKTCIYSKKIKSFDSEKSPNLHILKKIKKIKNLRLYEGLIGIDELVFDFFESMQVWWTSRPSDLHILKKIKSFDSEKSPNLHILKKIKKIKNQFIYANQSLIESEIFDFFDFFEYMQVWWLFTIKTFDFFEYMQVLCTFGITMLIFFEYMQVRWTSSLSHLHFRNLHWLKQAFS